MQIGFIAFGNWWVVSRVLSLERKQAANASIHSVSSINPLKDLMQCIPTFTFFFFLFSRGREGRAVKRIWIWFEHFSIPSSVIIMRNGFFHDEEFDILFSLIRSLRKIILDQVTKRMLWIGVSDDDSLTLRFVDCDARMQFQSWKSSILDFLRCIEKRSRDFLKKRERENEEENTACELW